MKLRHKLLTGVLVMLTSFSFHAIAADDAAAREKLRQFEEQRDAIYAHMKRYGINRDDVAAMRRLYEASPPYTSPHIKILTKGLLNPGEHYRIEMDEYILTMKVPDAKISSSWIWPYTNTRTPDPGMKKLLEQIRGEPLKVADLGWYVCNSIFPPGLFGRCETAGASMFYRILKPEERDNFSTPEKLRQLLIKVQRSRVPSQEELDQAAREKLIDNRRGNQIVLIPEPVVINGRIWIRQAMNNRHNQDYLYTTYLHPDRRLVVSAGLSENDYQADPDPSSYPGWVKKSLAQLEEMIASIRIAKTNDDGSPDPFIIERVEPAPLPVREKQPAVE